MKKTRMRDSKKERECEAEREQSRKQREKTKRLKRMKGLELAENDEYIGGGVKRPRFNILLKNI